MNRIGDSGPWHGRETVPQHGLPQHSLLSRVLREVAFVAPEQGRYVGRHDVEFAANALGLPRLEAADAEVAVDAGDHALEQLLVRLPGHGQDRPLVRREAPR